MREVLENTNFGRYALASRKPVYQLLLLLPLLVLYEMAAFIINFDAPFQLRNGADIIVKHVMHFAGIRTVTGFVFWALLFTSLLIVAAYRQHRHSIRVGYFGLMAVESIIYAIVVGIASAKLTGLVMGSNPFLATGGAPVTEAERVMIALGAGVYEEIIFRALLISVLLFVFGVVCKDERRKTILAVLGAALLFSAFHYVGEFGEAFVLTTFIFRFIAGLILSAIFVLRGIGVTAWAHALYDIFLVIGFL